MRNLSEMFESMQSLSQFVNENENVDEGLKDVWTTVKSKFKRVVNWFKKIVVNVKSYWLTVDDAGEVQPAITPLTAGQAYKDGAINKNSTLVVLGKTSARLVGLGTKASDAKSLYGKGNSLNYWRAAKLKKENLNNSSSDVPTWVFENGGQIDDYDEFINEVKLDAVDPQAAFSQVDTPALKKRIIMGIKNKKLPKLLIWGAPGIGKTAIINAVVEAMRESNPEYHLIVKTLSNETPENFTLPAYTNPEDLRNSMATDIPKSWLPVYNPTGNSSKDAALDAACGNGLLFIDELSRASAQVLNIILPLVNEGLFNGWKLGSGWTIVCASNRMEDEMSGQTSIGNALSNRFSQLYFRPTLNSWKAWAEEQNFISPLLLSWLSLAGSEIGGGKYFYWDPNEEGEGSDDAESRLMCTPRSWTYAMQVLAEYAKTADEEHFRGLKGFAILDIDTDILSLALNECIPSAAVSSFIAFLGTIKQIGDFDAAVYSIWSNGGSSVKIDPKVLASISLPMAQLAMAAHKDSLPTKEEFESMATWVVKSKSEQLASYVLANFKIMFLSKVSKKTLPTDDRSSMSYQDLVFTIKDTIANIKRADKNKRETQMNFLRRQYADFCSEWGIDFDDIPDYSDGLSKLAKAYGAAFEQIEKSLAGTGISGGLG